MTWQARIEHTPSGLALTFGAPLSRLDMSADVASHLASLLAVEARHRLAGVVRTLEVETLATFDRLGLPTIGEGSKVPKLSHALQCDCDGCLNGDHDHG